MSDDGSPEQLKCFPCWTSSDAGLADAGGRPTMPVPAANNVQSPTVQQEPEGGSVTEITNVVMEESSNRTSCIRTQRGCFRCRPRSQRPRPHGDGRPSSSPSSPTPNPQPVLRERGGSNIVSSVAATTVVAMVDASHGSSRVLTQLNLPLCAEDPFRPNRRKNSRDDMEDWQPCCIVILLLVFAVVLYIIMKSLKEFMIRKV